MQLKKQKQLRHLLTAATSSLLAGTSQQVMAAPQSDFQVDTAFLYYAEKDRVTVFEPVAKVRKEIGDDEFIGVKLVFDTLTGASPNGAVPTDSPQTFTSPSGVSTYTTSAGETPLDPSFHDTRVALTADWEMPLDEKLKAVFSGNFSSEYDYSSLGLTATLSWDFNQRNTTLATGFSLNHDQINPVGGAPSGLTVVPTSTAEQKSTEGDTKTKDIQEILLGLTQVVGPKTLVQMNYTMANETGYLSDPYKLLSVLDNAGNLRVSDPYLYEKRPDSRQRQALYFKAVHQFDADVLQASFRYYTDDWGVTSNTIDLRYRYELAAGRHYLQPHYRYYEQSKADFYYYSLQDGNIPTYASADYRLGDMSTTTFGLKYGMVMGEYHEFGMRLESMKQTAEGDAPFEDNTAIIFQLNYSFLF